MCLISYLLFEILYYKVWILGHLRQAYISPRHGYRAKFDPIYQFKLSIQHTYISRRLGSMCRFLVPTSALRFDGKQFVIRKLYEVDWRINVPLQQLLAASLTGDALGFSQLLQAFDTLELEIAMNYSVHCQSVNASFTWDLTNRSMLFGVSSWSSTRSLAFLPINRTRPSDFV